MKPEQIAALSRKIAEHEDPEPKWGAGRKLGRDHLSDGGFWWCELGSIGDRLQRNHARLITEPEIAMRLLKWLLKRGNAQFVSQAKGGHLLWFSDGNVFGVFPADSIEIGIALAFEKCLDEKGAR